MAKWTFKVFKGRATSGQGCNSCFCSIFHPFHLFCPCMHAPKLCRWCGIGFQGGKFLHKFLHLGTAGRRPAWGLMSVFLWRKSDHQLDSITHQRAQPISVSVSDLPLLINNWLCGNVVILGQCKIQNIKPRMIFVWKNCDCLTWISDSAANLLPLCSLNVMHLISNIQIHLYI